MNHERHPADDEKLLSHIDTQIESHFKFLDHIEQQRWKFTQAFGIAALTGLVFAGAFPELEKGFDIKHLGCLLALFVSIAGILTNIRIIGVYWAQWEKIRVLQNFKATKMELSLVGDVQNSWSLPEIVPRDDNILKKITVHESNCLLFSCLFSCSLTLMIDKCMGTGAIPVPVQVILVSIATCIITYICHKLGRSYYKSVFRNS
ncbi:MAG: hypothetical protein SV686_17085 [Thermodesulfobacteriota bacterium]|nr:hypothetical protein [Thermodesulfobacteriota bacterium]